MREAGRSKLEKEPLTGAEVQDLAETDPGDVNDKVLKRDKNYYKTGIHRPDWRKAEGGKESHVRLAPGRVLDQYSHPGNTGKFFAPKGTDYEALQLNDVKEKREIHRYLVLKELPAVRSKVALQPWNEREGMKYDLRKAATQYQTNKKAETLVKEGYLKELPIEKR